jgi:hypothetical protein
MAKYSDLPSLYSTQIVYRVNIEVYPFWGEGNCFGEGK